MVHVCRRHLSVLQFVVIACKASNHLKEADGTPLNIAGDYARKADLSACGLHHGVVRRVPRIICNSDNISQGRAWQISARE